MLEPASRYRTAHATAVRWMTNAIIAVYAIRRTILGILTLPAKDLLKFSTTNSVDENFVSDSLLLSLAFYFIAR